MTTRNYNHELKDTAERTYSYGFDLDVMHPYMLRTFEPFFRQGSLLELGSFQGEFTKRFLKHFMCDLDIQQQLFYVASAKRCYSCVEKSRTLKFIELHSTYQFTLKHNRN